MTSAVIYSVVEPSRPLVRHLGNETTGLTLCGIELAKTAVIVRPESVPSFVLCSKCSRAAEALEPAEATP
jgi:hypothetical protein